MANKSRVKLKGKLKTYLTIFTILGVLLIFINIGIFTVNFTAGLVLLAFTALYFVAVVYLNFYNRPIIMNELVSFATQYGQIQKKLLRELDLAHAVLDDTGKVVWSNIAFERIVHQEKGFKKNITALFPSITQDKFPEGYDEVSYEIDYEENNYTLKMKRISLQEMANNSDIIDADGYEGSLIAVYLFDETALKLAIQEVDNQSLAAGLIYLDNYEEALDSVEEVRRSLLTALIDRKINKYIAGCNGIAKKIEKDKYFVVMPKKSCEMLREQRFDLLEDVKTVNIGNEMAVTLSIGIGLNGLSYAQNYEFARNAIDLALGRGGDQAVVKSAENISYYGGKSQQVEKSTRVKARVKAHALREIISGKDSVIVMGHRLGDVDSFGASVGIYRIAKTLDRKCHIVLNDVTTSMQPLVELFKNNPEYEDDMIINNQQAIDIAGNNTVLVVVDVNKPTITECPELLRFCKTIVVLDHHRAGTEVIENATLSYVEPYASSACEMVSEILQYIGENVKIKNEEADSLYSGMIVDTQNFMNKTGVRTFEAAAFLRRNGADVTRVRKLFREDANEYKAKADAVSQAEVYQNRYAISVLINDDIQSPTIIGAQAANELLNIKGVRASFVCTEYQNQVYVSARSIDEVNVQVVMERLGGGGHMSSAGCQMEGMSAAEAVEVVKKTIDQMTEEGEL
ncbi:c-di-AMP phosphodiesterase, consists of a GGDEF-like and DHH domains [Butyrivibrio hungatei DSM 14810]|uniref:Cyclic-di-AMP phosphodiesterase n=1 Tax=Butyrivibrio hungatei DSM 14810 TaxID=1121132 RepID=A0A1M7SV88_9FIRM|nr:DHH family phosphoesterase [Butyrivibrio hungatei]SHN62372.1 c-di-AMP phosphodiesterase, consists of a GGDEF-like and DHH domains [Butyrivibrio hungatei DSM 14810]